jgi:hypothetical protein
MDVLEYWHPPIDWNLFHQGSLSDAAWGYFKQVVLLCHAYRHWEEDARDRRLEPPRHYVFPAEDKRQFKKRRDQWETDIRRSERHRDRAKFLADEAVVRCSHLGAEAAEGTADWKLGFALPLVVRVRPDAAAFAGFDAEQELAGEAEQIAFGWLRKAGYDISHAASA